MPAALAAARTATWCVLCGHQRRDLARKCSDVGLDILNALRCLFSQRTSLLSSVDVSGDFGFDCCHRSCRSFCQLPGSAGYLGGFRHLCAQRRSGPRHVRADTVQGFVLVDQIRSVLSLGGVQAVSCLCKLFAPYSGLRDRHVRALKSFSVFIDSRGDLR